MTTEAIEIPDRGVTVLPPWGGFIVLTNKRHENRVASVAAEAKRWIGQRIVITSSKTWDARDALEAAEGLAEEAECLPPNSDPARAIELLCDRLPKGTGYLTDRFDAWHRYRAGCIIGVAELVAVVENGNDPDGYWQVPGQWSLVLGRVWEVEPVPCTGGPGLFRLGRCSRCDRPIALTYDSKCKRCPGELTYPKALTVTAVRGPEGEDA